ncbi:cytochrome P450 [Oryzobacter telluris]|uniref:cytochrome P450 n=1 Tax=Oryzobacter telluris TaxID=3149179 RepID=UPI00370D2D78
MAPRPDRLDPALLPPGPRWPRLVQSVGLLRFRHRFVPWLHRRYGDVFTVRILPSPRATVLFTRPDAIRDIFAGDPEVFHAGEANSILGPVMGPHSLLLVDGAEHKRARRLLMPAFSGRPMRGYEGLVTDVARAEVAGWHPGVEFRSLDRMNALTLEVILRVVFGVTDEARLERLRPLVNATVDVNPAVLLGAAFPPLRRVGMWRRAAETIRELDAVIHTEIRERRASPDLATRPDVLSQLIRVDDGGDRLSDAELRDQLVTLLLAGHETTATALAWALHEVGRSVEQRERARAAAAAGDDAWLEAVLKESMRLHPVIPMVVRTLKAPATVGGVALPAGATVAASILVAHARPESHPEPEVFRPERFLGASPPPNSWLPFGGGVRRCIGAGFSLMEGVAVLREVFTAFDVEAVGDDEPRVRNITSVPRRGSRVVVSRLPRALALQVAEHADAAE